MSRIIDLTGEKFGKYTVLYRDNTKPRGKTCKVYWVCQCECGNIKSVRGDHLKSGATLSCGCEHKKIVSEKATIDLTGQKFGQLTVIRKVDKPRETNDRSAYWLCKCDCGGETVTSAHSLKIGKSNSCGCVKSLGEMKINKILQASCVSFIRQYSFSELISDKGIPLKFDFAIFDNNTLICVIEYQGEQHYLCRDQGWNNEENHKRLVKSDNLKKEYCKKNNIKLIEIPYWDFDKINENYLKEKIYGNCN